MGASVSGGGGQRRRGGRAGMRPMSEINVTPLVDVMLVLLIVFMVTAPLLAVGVPVDLPKSKARPIQTSEEPLTITINKDGDIFLQKTKVPYEELIPKLKAIAENSEQRIYIRGDKSVDYGTVLRVMGAVSAAGYTRIAMVSETER